MVSEAGRGGERGRERWWARPGEVVSEAGRGGERGRERW